MSAPLRAAQPEMTRQRRFVEGASPEARAAARPALLAWHKAVEAMVRAKKLKDLDYRLAVILTNYPSANFGKCWAGQKRLADQAGRCERTIREALGRLESAGLLSTRRGGQGRTSCYTFTLHGHALIATAERHAAADLDRQQIAGLDRQQIAAKPSELNPTEQEDSLPTLSHGGDVIDLVAERRARRPAITGFDFLAKCRRVENCKTGPALAEWNRLPPADREAIWTIIDRDGAIDLELLDVWAYTFLKNRMWEQLISDDLPKWAKEQIDRHFAAKQKSEKEPPKSAAQPFADRVFIEEDAPQWVAWTRHYREHGSPNGLRVGPRSFSYNGKQGNFFASEWPK
jgi:DNA-binding MarR family transcriptional regulator